MQTNTSLWSRKHLVFVLALLASNSACAEVDDDAGEVMSWEEYRDLATVMIDGQEAYVVEWDLPVTLEELEERYATYVAIEQGELERAAVNSIGGQPDIWSLADRFSLNYCVSNNFGVKKAKVVAEMASATAAWEAIAKVNFNYVAAQDAACVGTNPQVKFAVAPWASGGARAFFPSTAAPRTLWINIADLEGPNYDVISPNVTTLGVFRHELGHILGLRHEHTRPEPGTCFEDNSWFAITPYDINSVMHYPWCHGVTNSDLSLTASDRRGIQVLYGPPTTPATPQVGMRVRLRHGGTDKCIYSLGGNGGLAHHWDCWNDPGMVYVLDDAGNGRFRLRHEATSQCLYTSGGNGGSTYHWGCWNDPAMAFNLVPTLGGYRLRNNSANQSLYAWGGNGSAVYHWIDWGAPDLVYFVDVLSAQPECTWTEWKDRDDPGGNGDYETLASFPEVCANPTSILCETTGGVTYYNTGDVVTCNTTAGGYCVNANQSDGTCLDYKVKFCCP